MPLTHGSQAWLQGRAAFHAALQKGELPEGDRFLALSYVNSRSVEDAREDTLFGMRNKGHLATRYLKDRTWLGRLLDRLRGR